MPEPAILGWARYLFSNVFKQVFHIASLPVRHEEAVLTLHMWEVSDEIDWALIAEGTHVECQWLGFFLALAHRLASFVAVILPVVGFNVSTHNLQGYKKQSSYLHTTTSRTSTLGKTILSHTHYSNKFPTVYILLYVFIEYRAIFSTSIMGTIFVKFSLQ